MIKIHYTLIQSLQTILPTLKRVAWLHIGLDIHAHTCKMYGDGDGDVKPAVLDIPTYGVFELHIQIQALGTNTKL